MAAKDLELGRGCAVSGALSPTHWLIIVGVLVVLFGAKKLPDAARGLGQSMRIFKAEVSHTGGDSAATQNAATQNAATQDAATQDAATQKPPQAEPNVADSGEHAPARAPRAGGGGGRDAPHRPLPEAGAPNETKASDEIGGGTSHP